MGIAMDWMDGVYPGKPPRAWDGVIHSRATDIRGKRGYDPGYIQRV
jgi:hypothetical protein